MESKDLKIKSLAYGLIVAILPFLAFALNSLLLRFTGFGFTATFTAHLIKISWILMGVFFPLVTCPKNGGAFLRYFGFFSVCLIIAISPLALPALGEASIGFLAVTGFYYGTSSIFGVMGPVLVSIAAMLILGLPLKLLSIIRVALFTIAYDLCVTAIAPGRSIIEVQYGASYIYVSLVGALLLSESFFHSKNSIGKLLLTNVLIVGLSLGLLIFWDNFAGKMSLKSGQRFDSTVNTKIDLAILNELGKPENREKFLAYLNSSPYWGVQSQRPFRAVLREKDGELYLVKRSFMSKGPSLEVIILIKDVEPKIAIPDFDHEKFQEVDAAVPSADVIVFDSKFGKWDNRKEINLQVNAGSISIKFKETSKEKFGEILAAKINELRDAFSVIVNSSVEDIMKRNAFKGDFSGKCFYSQELRGSSLQVWGYVNGLEPGSVGVAVNGILQGYQQETIGWSKDASEAFYFEDAIYLRDEENKVSDVEVRFFADTKNRDILEITTWRLLNVPRNNHNLGSSKT